MTEAAQQVDARQNTQVLISAHFRAVSIDQICIVYETQRPTWRPNETCQNAKFYCSIHEPQAQFTQEKNYIYRANYRHRQRDRTADTDRDIELQILTDRTMDKETETQR